MGHAGTVFQLIQPAIGQTAWAQHTLLAFTGGSDGGQPVGSLIADNSGSGILYGTNSFGGAYSAGVVFSLTPSGSGAWTETILWGFTGQADDAHPVAALVQDAGGTVWHCRVRRGIGRRDGIFLAFERYCGWAMAVYLNLDPNRRSRWVHPTGTLILDAAGNLYGTTQFRGEAGCGQAKYSFYGPP